MCKSFSSDRQTHGQLKTIVRNPTKGEKRASIFIRNIHNHAVVFAQKNPLSTRVPVRTVVVGATHVTADMAHVDVLQLAQLNEPVELRLAELLARELAAARGAQVVGLVGDVAAECLDRGVV